MKKILFETQRQMARTLIDKTTRENHQFSKKAESRMLVEQASRRAIKVLREEEQKIRISTMRNPVQIWNQRRTIQQTPEETNITSTNKVRAEVMHRIQNPLRPQILRKNGRATNLSPEVIDEMASLDIDDCNMVTEKNDKIAGVLNAEQNRKSSDKYPCINV